MRRTGSTWLFHATVAAVVAGSACSGITIPPISNGVRVELQVSGGIAGVGYVFEVLGHERIVRGVSCSSGCDFEPGEVLLPLSVVQITRLAQDLEDGGILELDGTDFGTQCCDDFHYELRYASGNRTSFVEGSGALFPAELAAVIQRLVAFTRGTVPALVDLNGSLTLPDAPVTLGSHSLNGDLLEAQLSYGGGCARHEIDLVAVNGWMESHPVRVGMVFAHEDHDDPCDAFLTVPRSFDLGPVASAYREAYGTAPPGETILVLLLVDPESPNGLREIEYVF